MMASEAIQSATNLASKQGGQLTRFQLKGINCWGHFTPAGLSVYAPVPGKENRDWEHKFFDREDPMIRNFVPQSSVYA